MTTYRKAPPMNHLTRRGFLAGAAATATSTALLLPPAEAATYPIKGKIRETYLAHGGAKVFGAARGAESKKVISGVNTYGQRFAHGIVWWGSGVGRVEVYTGPHVRLSSKGPNFRPVRGVPRLWRTDDLDGCSPLDKRIVASLGIRTMIALNYGGDPSIPQVENVKHSVSNSGSHLEFYRGYVNRSASRRSFGATFRDVANQPAGVVIHCSAGKDRTGWAAEVLQRLSGVSQGTRDADYLATKKYSGEDVDLAWLNAARKELAKDYGTLDKYLRACGLSGKEIAKLTARVA